MKSVSLSNLTNKSRKIEIQNWRLEKFGTKGWLTKISFWLAEDFSGRLSLISNKIWTSHQGLRGQEEQRNRRTGKARAPSFHAAELQVHRYNQSPQTTLLVKRELSLAQKWWTLQDLQDWHHLHLLHSESGGQEETFHICQRHQGADHAKDLRADRLRTILRVHREQAKEWEKKLKSNRYWSVSQSRTRSQTQQGRCTNSSGCLENWMERISDRSGKWSHQWSWESANRRSTTTRSTPSTLMTLLNLNVILLASQRRRGQGMELQNLRWIATHRKHTRHSIKRDDLLWLLS